MATEGSQRDTLVTNLLELMPQDGSYEVVSGLHVHRISQVNTPVYSMPKPAFCVIAQGRKEVHSGKHVYTYDPDSYLVSGVNLPVTSQNVEASIERPYLSLRMELDPTVIAAVILEIGDRAATLPPSVPGLDVGPFDANMRDAVIRLVQLARDAKHINFLIPLVQKEIIYRLLTGEHGALLQHLSLEAGSGNGIAQAIELLQREYDQPLQIEQMAQRVGMSTSRFHHQFKIVTKMSPLQFQKQLRLQEARRLMFAEDFDATSAGFQVGYRNLSQFNREYKRQFGEPPIRDMERLRLTPGILEEYDLRPLYAMNSPSGTR